MLSIFINNKKKVVFIDLIAGNKEVIKNHLNFSSEQKVFVSGVMQKKEKIILEKSSFLAAALLSAAEIKTNLDPKKGFEEAVRMLLSEKNTLFESLFNKLKDYPELNQTIQTILFTGKSIAYNADETSIDIATMFGFVKNQNGKVVIANRIFETRLYNYYLSSVEMQSKDIYDKSLLDKNQFVMNGHLNMDLILERFVVHFHDIYGDRDEKFIEKEGRKYFLLYLRPIINGVGNYYIEAETRDQRRTDVIVDYLGERYIIELKIWHGEEYNRQGEEQLVDYLNSYHLDKGYMVTFSFNQKKEIGVRQVEVDSKTIIEAVV